MKKSTQFSNISRLLSLSELSNNSEADKTIESFDSYENS
jgi:hypothetical protein